MTKPRLQAPSISLPVPSAKYDPKQQTETLRLIKAHMQNLQPQQARQVITGSRGGNAALASLLTALANLGYITDSTTA